MGTEAGRLSILGAESVGELDETNDIIQIREKCLDIEDIKRDR